MKSKTGLEFGGFSSAYDFGRKDYSYDIINYIDINGTVLEVGSGTGKGTKLLTKYYDFLTISEPNHRMYSILKDKFPNLNVLQVRYEDISKKYDHIIGFQCWHWFDNNKFVKLDEILNNSAYFIWRWYKIKEKDDYSKILKAYKNQSILDDWLYTSSEDRVFSLLDEYYKQNLFSMKSFVINKTVQWSMDDFINHAMSRIDHQHETQINCKELKKAFSIDNINLIETYFILKLVKKKK